MGSYDLNHVQGHLLRIEKSYVQGQRISLSQPLFCCLYDGSSSMYDRSQAIRTRDPGSLQYGDKPCAARPQGFWRAMPCICLPRLAPRVLLPSLWLGEAAGVWHANSTSWVFKRGVSMKISMSLRSGIVGLPNVGKSTLFNALVENGKAQAANFPFCTIEPNVGIVGVPDPRLDVLTKLSTSKQTVPANMEFVDIAGLVKGASQGEGLGNKFLQHIREVDSIVQVVRCFEDNDILHVNGKVDPEADIDIINLELAFADLAQIEKRLDKIKKSRAKDPQTKAKEEMEAAALQRINETLLAGKAARTVELSDDEKKAVQQLCLLTMKPVVFAANVAEGDLTDPSKNDHVQKVMKTAVDLGSEVVVVSAQVEAELSELDAAERKEYLESLGASEGGLGSLVKATYSLLGLRTYFTTGEKETKAWTIRSGMTAPQAAGVIHSDFERGFIRAETVAYQDFVSAGSLSAARERGLLRSEGKDYVVQEGDVMLFRFNV